MRYDQSKRIQKMGHFLVACAFLGEPKEGETVDWVIWDGLYLNYKQKILKEELYINGKK